MDVGSIFSEHATSYVLVMELYQVWMTPCYYVNFIENYLPVFFWVFLAKVKSTMNSKWPVCIPIVSIS